MQTVVDLLCEMIAIDSRSSVSNVPLANFMQSQLDHWEIERIDYVDAQGIAKTNIVAADPESASPLAFAGHLDTVSPAGWNTDPFRAANRGRPTHRAWCDRYERPDRGLPFVGSENGSPGAAENRAHRR
jgi:acetylornithine deacetylase